MDMHENCVMRTRIKPYLIQEKQTSPLSHTPKDMEKQTHPKSHTPETTLGRRGENASSRGYANSVDCAPRN